MRVKAFDSDAAFGHTGGGTLNQVLKSGTNGVHGSLWESNQPNNLAANNFFNNKARLGNPVTHYNQYGVTAGRPVWIPKVFNRHDKLFWFFAFEGLKDSQPNTTFLTVPTAKESTGDFSDLLKPGSSYQLYNPYTAEHRGAERLHCDARALPEQRNSREPAKPCRPGDAEILSATRIRQE